MYSCESKKLFDTVADIFSKLLESLNTEELVYSEEDGEVSQIYIVSDNNNEPTAMLIYNSDKDFDEINIVVIHGKIIKGALPGATD